MHPYVIDSNERRNVYFLLSMLSALAAWILHVIITCVEFIPPWWLEIPSIIGFYGLIFIIFNNWLWSTKFIKSIGLVKVPNLTGAWNGTIGSSYGEVVKTREAKLRIFQSWTGIKILLETQDSTSRSLTVSMITTEPDEVLVTYEYLNEPKMHSSETMQIHRGTAKQSLKVVNGEETFDGEYYSGRGRSTFGILIFRRKPA